MPTLNKENSQINGLSLQLKKMKKISRNRAEINKVDLKIEKKSMKLSCLFERINSEKLKQDPPKKKKKKEKEREKFQIKSVIKEEIF